MMILKDIVVGLLERILNVEIQLNKLYHWLGEDESISGYKALEKKHANLLKDEETPWRQRSRTI